MTMQPKSDEALVKRLLPSQNPDHEDRAVAWWEWYVNVGKASVDLLQPGLALVAAGDHHLELTGNRRVRVTDGPSVHGVRPAVDVMLKSVLRTHGDSTVVGILTGMGSDGAKGSVAVSEAGGRIVAEDESTCVVFGMPQAVVLTGVVNAVVPLPEIAFEIQNQLSSLRIKQRAVGR